jgi:ATP-dependent Zn protease
MVANVCSIMGGFIGLDLLKKYLYPGRGGASKHRARRLRLDKSLKDFYGQSSVLEHAARTIEEVSNYKKFYKILGAQRIRSIFIEGVRGCGKTLLARAIAGELKRRMIYISGYWFVESGPGLGGRAMDEELAFVLSSAKKKKTILFFDDLDAITHSVVLLQKLKHFID